MKKLLWAFVLLLCLAANFYCFYSEIQNAFYFGAVVCGVGTLLSLALLYKEFK